MNVLHDFGTDDFVEGSIRKWKLKCVAVNQRAQAIALGSALLQIQGVGLEGGEIKVEANDVSAALEGAKTMPPFATTGVEEPLARANPKSLEIDGEQHESFPRKQR